MAEAGRRRRVEPTDDWEQLAYEEMRPAVLFGLPVAAPRRADGLLGEDPVPDTVNKGRCVGFGDVCRVFEGSREHRWAR